MEQLNNEAESWEVAGAYAKLIRTLPERISYVLRILREEYVSSEDSEIISDRALSYVRGIDRFEAIRAPIYFGAAALFPAKFEKSEDDTSKALLRALGPGVFASFLACVWYYRRLARFVDGHVWDRYSNDFFADAEIGFEIGSALPNLGSATGLIFGAMRSISLGTFAMQDADLFSKYMNLHKGKFNLSYEHDRYNCDHAQVGVYLLQNSYILHWGPGGDKFTTSRLEVREALLGRSDSDGIRDPWMRDCALCLRGVNQLYAGKTNFSWLAEFGATSEGIERVTEAANRIASGVFHFDWLARGADRTEE